MNQPNDQQIETWAREIRKSDRKAFDSLFRAMYPGLVRFAASYTRENSSACDIVQDTFVILWQKREEIDLNRSLRAFLYQIVRNRSLNYIRDHANETLLPDQEELDRQSSGNPPGSEEESSSVLSDRFREWINRLPERQQEAFKLSRFEGLDHEEIAEVMNISAKTVNNHIVAALSKLKTEYNNYQNQSTQ